MATKRHIGTNSAALVVYGVSAGMQDTAAANSLLAVKLSTKLFVNWTSPQFAHGNSSSLLFPTTISAPSLVFINHRQQFSTLLLGVVLTYFWIGVALAQTVLPHLNPVVRFLRSKHR